MQKKNLLGKPRHKNVNIIEQWMPFPNILV